MISQIYKDVKPENTGWRDEGLSRRHRLWGAPCPMIDIDFLAVEYFSHNPAMLIEYKNENAKQQDPNHPSYVTLRRLATNSKIPFFAVRYSSDYQMFWVVPQNDFARIWIKEPVVMSEKEFIEFQYRVRGNKEIPWSHIKDQFQKNGVQHDHLNDQ